MSPSLVIQFPVFSIKADLLNHTTAIIAFPMNSTVIYIMIGFCNPLVFLHIYTTTIIPIDKFLIYYL